MKAGKKAGPPAKVRDKMRAAFAEQRRKDNKAIDAEPACKGGCDCGSKKA